MARECLYKCKKHLNIHAHVLARWHELHHPYRRRGWESNPRKGFPFRGLANLRTRPLCDLSVHLVHRPTVEVQRRRQNDDNFRIQYPNRTNPTT